MLRYTLLADGSSDKVLIPIINWLLVDLGVPVAVQGEWADLSGCSAKFLQDRVAKALDLYDCDLLFIHRDAEAQSREQRLTEINSAIGHMDLDLNCNFIPIIPIRMTESWLLISEDAIRFAAENTNGTVPLDLPRLSRLEHLIDPKEKLYGMLRTASQKTGRRLREFKPQRYVHRISHAINDFSPLRSLSSFRDLETDIRAWMTRMPW
jgi:hypothetical protein